MSSPEPTDLVALADRWRYLSVWRAVLAGLTAALAVVAGTTDPVVAGLAVAAHLGIAAAVAVAWGRYRQRSLRLHGVGLVADAALGGVVLSVIGQPGGLLTLAALHVVAVSLLASHRSGVRIALLSTCAVTLATDLAGRDLLPWTTAPDAEPTVLAVQVALLWVAAFVTGSMSAANERELRRRRRDLEGLNGLGRRLTAAATVPDVARAVVDRVADHFDVPRVALVELAGPDVRFLAGAGTAAAPPPAPLATLDARSVLRLAPADGTALLAARLGPADAWLAQALPDATGLVVVRLPARHRHGALVLETRSSRLERRVAATVEQFAATAAGALDAVTLLERANYYASTDPLTGVANRRVFDVRLAEALLAAARHGERVGVVLLDVDHFKRINDTHGHDVGDRVLAAVGRCLQAHRRADDLAARLGGEEFVLLVREHQPGDTVRAAERLRAALPTCDPLAPTASFGVAVSPGDGTTPASLVKAADAASYRAKGSGRDRIELAPGAAGAQGTSATFPPT